ncbi:MAG TPA: TonB-dependent receptor [Longimicrobiaceae bacterium]|nr:TonB-dependent receptor [Longimicrobiaceae bacterium]
MCKLVSRWLLPALACAVLALCASVPLAAQQVTVHGTVVTEQNDPLPGAAVSVEGTTAMTTSNAEGAFSIAAPSDTATLVVSYAGYTTAHVPLGGHTSVVVKMQAATQLEGLVVVGYGTQKAKDVTGSVATVSSDKMEDRGATTVEQALEGTVPGVSITTGGGGAEPNMSIMIRGQNSLTASNSPLIVVDGIPYEGSISEINQNDVQSISVLKDASATAIYGSRGSNGVVLITTKKGRGAPSFGYSGYAGMQQITNVPRLMNGAEFAQFKCDRVNGGENCDDALTATELDNLNAGRSTDWVGLGMHTGYQQQHNLSFSGSAQGIQYYIGGSLLDVSGVAKNDKFDRYTLRANVNSGYSSWLTMGTNTQMSYTDRGGLPVDFTDAFFMNPLTNAYNDDGTLTITPWPEDLVWANPLQNLLVKNDDVTRRVFTSNFIQLDAPFLPGLSYRLNAGLDYAAGKVGTYYGRNTKTGYDTQGYASTQDNTRFDWTVENLLKYDRTFGKSHVDLTGLYSFQGNNVDEDHLTSQGFPNDVLTYYQANLAALVTPSYVVSHSGLISQMARLNYDYDSRYLLTLTARRDGYSGFGASNKYGVFPSVAVGWNLSNEAFWPKASWWNLLKLRASYGQNGNQAIPPYRTLARLSDDSYIANGQTAPGFIPSTLGTPDLKWETTTSLNLGADFGLLNNRLSGSLDVYSSKTHDLLVKRTISPVHGITSIYDNVGELQNRGVELNLSSLNVNGRDFGWTTDFNIAANRNKIVSLYGDTTSDVGSGWFIGHPIDVLYDYKFAGIWQEGDDIADSAQPDAHPGDVKIVDLNGDGKINPDDRTFLGSLYPDYTANMTNTFRYKNFSLSGLFQTVQGVERENGLLGMNLVQTGVRRNTIYRTYWTPDNPSNTVPRNSDKSNPLSVPFLQDASFIRLKDVTLSYDLPASLTNRLGTESLRVYVSGRNLWTHTAWTGMDPEFTNGNQRGIPLQRVLIGGVNVQF